MRKFGIEIEGYSLHDMETFCEKVTNKTNIPLYIRGWQRQSTSNDFWTLTTDGSVKIPDYPRRKGWEIVSPPLEGEDGLSQLKLILRAIRSNELFGSDRFKINKSCSVHVHLDRSDLTNYQLKKVFYLYAHIESDLNLMFPQSRRNNTGRDGHSYCAPIKGLDFDEAVEHKHHELKYYSVNFPHGIPTIEFRIHGATCNYKKIKNWIIILNEIMDFAVKTKSILKFGEDEEKPYLEQILSKEMWEYYKSRVANLQKKEMV